MTVLGVVGSPAAESICRKAAARAETVALGRRLVLGRGAEVASQQWPGQGLS